MNGKMDSKKAVIKDVLVLIISIIVIFLTFYYVIRLLKDIYGGS